MELLQSYLDKFQNDFVQSYQWGLVSSNFLQAAFEYKIIEVERKEVHQEIYMVGDPGFRSYSLGVIIRLINADQGLLRSSSMSELFQFHLREFEGKGYVTDIVFSEEKRFIDITVNFIEVEMHC